MFNLSKKGKHPSSDSSPAIPPKKQKMSIRDLLLVKEVQELNAALPITCKVTFPDPDALHEFNLEIRPDEGYWKDGIFEFSVSVPHDYNCVPPMVKCKTKLWHPNINEDGKVCLSILRRESIDSMGWNPTRSISDVILGLSALFTDLLNFDDPLNTDAAEEFQKDPKRFEAKVKQYIKEARSTNSKK